MTWYVIRDSREIAIKGELSDVFPFAQRERYCIWGINPNGTLSCTYNPNNPAAPTYPDKGAIDTMRFDAAGGIIIGPLEYHADLNQTFARVVTREFTDTFHVSGRVRDAAEFRALVTPLVTRMIAEVA